MTETLQKPEIFVAGDPLKSIFQKAFSKSGLKSGKHGWRTIKTWDTVSSKSIIPLLVAWMLEDVTREGIKRLHELNRPTIYLLFKGRLPSKAVADRIAWLNVRDTKRIHFVESEESDEEVFAERLLRGLENEDDDNRILDAWWEEDIIVVVSPGRVGFKKLRVPLEKLPVLKNRPKEELENFEIDEDGIFLHWPDSDIHLGWEQFEQAVNQKAYLKAKQQVEQFNESYGSAIKKLRQICGLPQSKVKGLTDRQVRRIEQGQCRATYIALNKLAKAHHMSLSDYMDKLANLM